MTLSPISISSIITNAVAVGILSVLLAKTQIIIKDKTERVIFSLFTLAAIVLAFSEAIVITLIESLEIKEYHSAVFMVFNESLINMVFLLSLMFVNYHLYGEFDYIKRKFIIYLTPFFLAGGVSFATQVGLFFSSKMVKTTILTLAVLYGVRILYLVFSAILFARYKKQNDYQKFFNLTPFLAVMAAGLLLAVILPHSTIAFFTAVGSVFLFYGIDKESRYIDSESGFYTREQLPNMRQMIEKKGFAPAAAMVFTTADGPAMVEFSGILSDILPPNCEPVRVSENSVVVLTTVSDRMALDMVTEDAKDMSDVSTSIMIKEKEETSEEFMERVFDNAEV